MLRNILLSAAAILGATAAVAQAHVTFAPAQATAGGYYVGELRVTHGCAGAATTALRVEIPPGIVAAKPQPKPGWTLEVEREPLARPVRGESGALLRDRVKAVTWRGRLPDDEFDTFGLMLRPPAAPGPLYFPTVQTCGAAETRWTDIPAPGQAWRDAPHPAPTLTITPAGPGGGDAMPGMAHGTH